MGVTSRSSDSHARAWSLRDASSIIDHGMEVADIAIKPVKDFARDSVRLVKKCTKPDAEEFWKIAMRTATGFVIMGFVGFFVKLVFIPINNIILSA